MAERLIQLENIHKDYGGKTVLKNINLYVRDKEFVTLLGPSGCGKTTTLRLIGGFETPTAGVVYFDGKDITHLPPHQRQVNTVFQRYALFPHLNVYENIAFGLRLKKLSEAQIRERVEEMLRLINLTGYEKSAISRLSGGEQQRVGITFVFVTHDQEEALTMSDTVVVMNKGSIQQIGTPTDIYNEPKNAFVADFIGESNILDGVMLADRKVRFSGHTFDCVDGGFGEKEPVDVVVRPEDVDIVAPEKGMLRGNVSTVTFMGVHYEIIVDINGFKWMIQTTDFVAEGSHIGLYIEPDAIHIMKKSEYSGLYGDYSLDIDPEAVPAESERAE